MAQEADMAKIGRFVMFLRRYDSILGPNSVAVWFREHPTNMRNLYPFFPNNDGDERIFDDANHGEILQEFKEFYDNANVIPRNNFLTEFMKQDKSRSIALLQQLSMRCMQNGLYTEIDEFIQWVEPIDDEIYAQLISDIQQNESNRLTRGEKQTLRAHSAIFMFRGLVAAYMNDDVRNQAGSLKEIFLVLNRGPFSLVAQMVSSDESSESSGGDGN